MIPAPDAVDALISDWLDIHEPDRQFNLPVLPHKMLRRVVVERCKLRENVFVPAKKDGEFDPCVCGCQTTYHMECYFHYLLERDMTMHVSDPNSFLEWRNRISKEARQHDHQP